MHMVADSTYYQCLEPVIARDATDIRPEVALRFFRDERLAALSLTQD